MTKASKTFKPKDKWRFYVAGVLILWLLYRLFVGLVSLDVKAATAERGTAIKAVSGTITVEAEVETQLLATGSGFLLESDLSEGRTIQKDEVLAEIDPDNLPFVLESTKVELEDIRKQIERGSSKSIQLKSIQRKISELQLLLKQGHASKSEYDELLENEEALKLEIQQEIDTLNAQKKIKESKVRQLEKDIRQLAVTAPMNGTITQVHAFVGDLISKGTPLANIMSDDMKISAEVDQDDIDVIQKGGIANVRFFAFGNQLFKAIVRQVLPSSDPETQRFTVYLDMEEQPSTMFPGMTGEVSFYADEHPNAIIIPRRALLGNIVFVINDDNKLERRKVTTGYLSYSDAEIIEGVDEGERVVVENLSILRDGDRVAIKELIDAND